MPKDFFFFFLTASQERVMAFCGNIHERGIHGANKSREKKMRGTRRRAKVLQREEENVHQMGRRRRLFLSRTSTVLMMASGRRGAPKRRRSSINVNIHHRLDEGVNEPLSMEQKGALAGHFGRTRRDLVGGAADSQHRHQLFFFLQSLNMHHRMLIKSP